MKLKNYAVARISLRTLAFVLACASLCSLPAHAVDRGRADGLQAMDLADPPPIGGIGILLQAMGTNLVVAGIVRDTPAASPSEPIYVGDRILAIAQDGKPAVPVDASKLNQAIDMIRGPAGTVVSLTLVSRGDDDSQARVVRLTRAVLKMPPH